MSYPIVRKGQIYTPVPTGYGASLERYQKRFSRKTEEKLQRKLARFQRRLARLESRDSWFGRRIREWRIANLQKKIQAIEIILGMQPFEMNLTDQAYNEQMAIAEQNEFNPMWLVAGGLLVGGMVFVIVQRRK